MKILLVSINARYSHSNLAIYYLKKYCTYSDSSISIEEFTINQEADFIAKKILHIDADVIAFSTYIWNITKTIDVIDLIKSSNKIIISGGPEVSYNTQWHDSDRFHHIIIGEGEESFRYLVDNNFTVDEKIIHVTNRHFNEIPFPYSAVDLINLNGKLLYYESSRGCPHSCSFCLSAKNNCITYKDIKNVCNELLIIIENYNGTVKFVDRTFNSKKNHYQKIWNFLLDNHKDDITFHFEIYPEHLDQDDFDILERVPEKYFQFEMGIQSTDKTVLKKVGRKQNLQKIQYNTAKLLSYKTIHIHTDQIAGLPLESKESLIKSFNDIYYLFGDHFQPGLLKIIPGTGIWELSKKDKFIYSEKPPYEIISTPQLTQEDIHEYDRIAQGVNAIYNSKKFQNSHNTIIKLFHSPYEMYNSITMSKYWKDLTLNKWDAIGLSIIDTIRNIFPKQTNEISDWLLYDWALFFNNHHLPQYINDSSYIENRNKILKKMQILKKGNTLHFDNNIILFSDIKKSIFIKPKSEEFKKRILFSGQCLMITPDKRHYNIISTDRDITITKL